LGGLLALNAAVFLAFTLPLSLRERSVAARTAALSAEVERDGRLVAALRERADTIRANTRDTKRFYDQVVGQTNDPLLPTLEYVEETARDLGLVARSRAYSREEVKKLALVRFVITMPLSGPYKQIVGFLDRLERSSRFVVVDQVQLRSRSDVGADLSFALSTYFREGVSGGGG
jgi:hypothetical protein